MMKKTMTKATEISELERLRMQKVKLRAESETYLKALDEHLEYLRSHADSLFLETAVSTAKSRLPQMLQSLICSETGMKITLFALKKLKNIIFK